MPSAPAHATHGRRHALRLVPAVLLPTGPSDAHSDRRARKPASQRERRALTKPHCTHRLVTGETLKATRKNVLAKCYGGDVSRKKKLLEKQKEGKKRAALTVGNTGISIPQEAFIAVLAPDKGNRRR